MIPHSIEGGPLDGATCRVRKGVAVAAHQALCTEDPGMLHFYLVEHRLRGDVCVYLGVGKFKEWDDQTVEWISYEDCMTGNAPKD